MTKLIIKLDNGLDLANGPFQGHPTNVHINCEKFIKDHLIAYNFGTVTWIAVWGLLECVIPKIVWLQAKSQWDWCLCWEYVFSSVWYIAVCVPMIRPNWSILRASMLNCGLPVIRRQHNQPKQLIQLLLLSTKIYLLWHRNSGAFIRIRSFKFFLDSISNHDCSLVATSFLDNFDDLGLLRLVLCFTQLKQGVGDLCCFIKKLISVWTVVLI